MTDTETKWTERVRAWRASGRTAREFAEGQEFKPSTLTYWASQLRRSGRVVPAKGGEQASGRLKGWFKNRRVSGHPAPLERRYKVDKKINLLRAWHRKEKPSDDDFAAEFKNPVPP